MRYNDVYVDYDSNATESGYLPSTIRNHIITQIIDVLLQDNGLEIYKKFIYLLSKYYGSSATFSDLLALFRENGQISTLAQQIFINRNDPQNVLLLKTDFRIQFISGTLAVSGALKGSILSQNDINIEDLSLIKEKHIKTLLEYYLTIDYILLYAIHLVRKQDAEIVFNDNLDIIDNPQHIFFINKLQEVLHKISHCYNNESDSAPVFNVIIAVRKITYSLTSSFVEVREPERGFDDIHANFLDISNLYSSIQLLKYKAKILLDNFQDYIPNEYDRTDVKNFLRSLIQTPEEILKDICLPDLFNHN